MNKENKEKLLDEIGKIIIEEVRDLSLENSMKIANYELKNQIVKDKYKELSNLSELQKEAVCNLLSATISTTIFYFLDIFEANHDKIELLIKSDEGMINMREICDQMGAEITFDDENGWIQKFSKIGRFNI